MSAEPTLEVDDLTKRFGGIVAVDEVSFSVAKEETKALIGPNGAGKTTLLNCISGIYESTSGTVRLHGKDVTNRSPETMASAGIGRTYQITNIFDEFTVFENIRLASQIATDDNRNPIRHYLSYEGPVDKTHDLLEEIGLSDRAQVTANTLAHGERRQLEIGLALATEPDLLLLDEPTAGMASNDVNRMTTLIDQLGENYSIVLIEHNVELVMNLADAVMVLNQGKLIADGPSDEVRTDERVRNAYLGTDSGFLEGRSV